FFFSSRRRHTRFSRDWSSDVCSSDLPVQEIRIVDAAKQTELSRTYTDLVEVYEVEASSADKKTMLHLRGVNFTPNMTLFSENCLNFISAREPSSTEMVYSCDLSVGIFSSSDSLDLKVSRDRKSVV